MRKVTTIIIRHFVVAGVGCMGKLAPPPPPPGIRQFYVLLLTRRLLSVLPTWWRVYVQSLPTPTEPFEARCLSSLESEMLLYIQ